MYLPFKVLGHRIHEIKPTGHQHWNRKEILNKNSGGDFPKNDIFYANGPYRLYRKQVFETENILFQS